MDATDRNLCEHNTAMTRPHISLRRASHRAKGRLGKQSGVALVTALLMLFVLSLVVTAMITTSQQEMWTNANFRATTQARYVAEGGAQAAIYYLKNTWTLPATSSFTLTSYPITFSSNNSNIVMASSNFGNLSDTYSSFDSAGDAAFDAKISSFQTTLQGSISTAKIAVAAAAVRVPPTPLDTVKSISTSAASSTAAKAVVKSVSSLRVFKSHTCEPVILLITKVP